MITTLYTLVTTVYTTTPHPSQLNHQKKRRRAMTPIAANQQNENWLNAAATQDQYINESPPKLPSKFILLSISTFVLLTGTKKEYKTYFSSCE